MKYLNEAYTQKFSATVTAVDGKYIVLDKTYFYPKGGGQPHDTGKIDNYDVVFVVEKDGFISHEVDREGLKEGDEVTCQINWQRRYRLMKMHTAAHIISEIIHRETGAKITGNQLDTEKSRIDFNLEDFDKEVFKEYIEKANAIVKKDLAVSSYYVKRDEALAMPTVTKLAMNLPDRDEFRIVEIDGFDKQADGGTHVTSTKEIGGITLLEVKNKGKNNRRLYFTVA